MTDDRQNRYLFHWLSPEKLVGIEKTGLLRPYWRHYLLDQERFVRGVSFCKEPMLWNPDEELPREPCLIIDRELISCPTHLIDSGPTYHITKDILRAKRNKQDLGPVIERARASMKRTTSVPDEVFVEGFVRLDWVVAIGYEVDEEAERSPALDCARSLSEKHEIPLLDMTGWVVSSPGYDETDEYVDNARREAGFAMVPKP